MASPGLGCPGGGMRGRRPLIAALPVRFLRGPERIVDRDAERQERKDKTEETREGRRALACVPPSGLSAPNAPRLGRGWEGSETAQRGSGARRTFTNIIEVPNWAS